MDKVLDMSLDDIIKSKKSAGRGRGRGNAPRGRGTRGGSIAGGRMRGTVRGTGRQPPLGVNNRSSSSAISKSFRRAKNVPWRQDLIEDSLTAAGLPRVDSGTKLYISNLDHGVSNDDIRELFSEIGELKRYAIHFDKNGQASGSAEVVYAKRSDAFAAHKRYNNVQLDGRPMRIEVVTPNSEVPVSTLINVVGGTKGKAARRVVMTAPGRHSVSSALTNRGGSGVGQRTRGGLRNVQGHSQNQSRGMRRGQGQGRGRGRGRGRGKNQNKSAEQLDKELENYHAAGNAEGMQE